jgi:hypothetical protein
MMHARDRSRRPLALFVPAQVVYRPDAQSPELNQALRRQRVEAVRAKHLPPADLTASGQLAAAEVAEVHHPFAGNPPVEVEVVEHDPGN